MMMVSIDLKGSGRVHIRKNVTEYNGGEPFAPSKVMHWTHRECMEEIYEC